MDKNNFKVEMNPMFLTSSWSLIGVKKKKSYVLVSLWKNLCDMGNRNYRRLDLMIQEDPSSLLFLINLLPWSFPQGKEKNSGKNPPSSHVFQMGMK